MKKIFLLLSIMALLPISNVLASETESVSSLNTDQIMINSNVNIYSDEYPNDYDVWIDSAYTNRFLNEFSKEFDIQLDENMMTFWESNSYGKIKIDLKDKENIELDDLSVSYSTEMSANQYLVIGIDMEQEWNSVSEELFTKLVKILAPHLNEEEIKQGYTLTKESNRGDRIKNVGFTPLFVFNYFDEDEILDLLHNERSENTNKIILENGNDKVDELLDSILSYSFNPDDYEIITYEDIMRDRSGKEGTKHTFYAEVLQYFEDGDRAMAMLMRNGSSDMIYQAVFLELPDQRLVEGDDVDVYGTLMGLESYETVRGSENTTPLIRIDEILIKGIDY